MSSSSSSSSSHGKAPAAKKRAAPDAENDANAVDPNTEFVDGAIVRVRMVNFITYDDVEVRPGARLNVVVGPNGSGKSSIVCALALGLGGSPSVLGRASRAHEFIRHGADRAELELELHRASGRNCVVKRIIKREHASEYYLDGVKAKLADVQLRMKRMGVSVDNLCQFLPQDKVAEFARLNSRELLRECERAIERRGEEPLQLHAALSAKKKAALQLSQTVLTKQERIDKIKAQQERLRRDMEQFKRRKLLDHELLWLRRKLPWMKFEELRTGAVRARAEYEEAAKRKEEIERELAPMKQRRKEAKAQASAAKKEQAAANEALQRAHAAYRKLAKECGDVHDKLSTNHQQLADLGRTLAERKRKAEQAEDALKQKQAELAAFEEQLPDAQAEFESAQREEDAMADEEERLKSRDMELQQEKRHLAAEEREKSAALSELQNAEMQRLQAMRQARYPGSVLHGHRLVREGSVPFAQTVHGPVISVLNCTVASFAVAVETMIPFHIKAGFVVSSPGDRAKLRKEVSVNVALLEKKPSRERLISDERKAALGIVNWMDEVVECPPMVMDYLIAGMRIHTIALCRLDADAKAIEEAGVKVYIIGDNVHRAKQSRYGAKLMTTSVNNISNERARVLAHGGAGGEQREQQVGELKKRMAALARQARELNGKREKIRSQFAEIASKRRDHNAAKATLRELKTRIKRTTLAIEDARMHFEQAREHARSDGKAEREKLQRAVRQLNAAQAKNVERLALQAQKVIEQARLADEATLRLDVATERDAAIGVLAQNAQERINDATDEMLDKQDEYKQKKSQLRDAKRYAEEQCPITEESKAEFEKLPKTETLVSQRIEEIKSMLATMRENDPGVIREYEKRERELEQLEATHATDTDELNAATAEVAKLHAAWLPIVTKLAADLNQHFSRFMHQLGCAGEVVLEVDEQDYDNCQLQIRVSFRSNSDLQTLSVNVQSGGERSVATMVFLIALQDLAQCPFRLVDEVNQGMDPRNERSIFSLVVDAATRPNTPQYFLITPKLLPDLQYNEATTVLCVYNGPASVAQAEVDIDGFLHAGAKRRQKRRKAREQRGAK